jgi:hypothetical protein
MTAAIEAGERWVTKQQLAEHLQATRHWIESQQPLGLPYLRMGGMNRYVISEVEARLRERYTLYSHGGVLMPFNRGSRHKPKWVGHVKYKGTRSGSAVTTTWA